jgi:hypothetical protein
VRNHHLFLLMSQVDGSNWLVHDGNSGHGLIREHVQSISRYTVVNPQGTDVTAELIADPRCRCAQCRVYHPTPFARACVYKRPRLIVSGFPENGPSGVGPDLLGAKILAG